MKRNKLYSMLALGLAVSLAVSVPVSAAVSPDTTNTTVTDETTGITTETTTVGDKENGGDYTETVTKTDAEGNVLGTTVEKVETAEDGTKTESKTEERADGTVSESTVVTKPDGSRTETQKEQRADGTASIEEVATGADGSTTIKKAETNAAGEEVKSTETTKDSTGLVVAVAKKDADVSPEVEQWKADESVAAPIRNTANAEITVTVPELTEAEKEIYNAQAKEMLGQITPESVAPGTPGVDLTVKPVAPDVLSVAAEAASQMVGEIVKSIGANQVNTAPDVLAAADIHVENYEAGKSYDIAIPMAEGVFDTDAFDYFVLHCKADGTWETLPARIVGNQVVIATFDEFSPIFIVKSEKMVVPAADPSGEGSEDNGSEDNGDNSGSSTASVNLAKAGNTPAATGTPAVPANPAVSPKTGE